MLHRGAQTLVVLAMGVFSCQAIRAGPVDTGASCTGISVSAAREAALSGDYVCARSIYSRLMLDEPANVDHVFSYAQVLHWSGDDTAALQYLVTARSMAPDYEDVWQLEAKVRQRLGNDVAADDRLEFERSARQQFGDVGWLGVVDESPSLGIGWTIGASRSRLSTDAPDWQLAQVSAEIALRSGLSVAIVGTRSTRFNDTDWQSGGAIGYDFSDRWFAQAGFLASGSATHLPKAETWLDVAGKIGTGWVGYARLRQRDYGDSVVRMIGVAMERYTGPFRLEYALGAALLDSEQAYSHRIVVERYLSSGAALGAIAAVGEEIDVPAPGQLRRLDSRSVVLTTKWPIGADLTFALNLGVHEYRNLYWRTELGLALSGAF